ncbi:DEAD/DEAH box helicase [Pseudobowmanella zhangzhouensis]|uniref:DEAD/DEAH box helicase n=1 Tax=Pseudobowmanella zhangzhouensis TaxID=1537679 RepID=UPI00360B84F8
MSAFSQFSLPDSLLANLDSMGIQNPTEIQQAALPALLAGDDLIAQAATGSGKTLTFALPIALKVTSDIATQALVLCPTRELAEQVADTIRTVLRVVPNIKVQTLCGGQPMGPQIQSLRHAPQVIVATPGRLVEHVEKRRVDLRTVSQLVLDEADRMLDVGFADDLDVIFHAMAPGHQTMLFSATYTDEINRMCETWLPTAQRSKSRLKSPVLPNSFIVLAA